MLFLQHAAEGSANAPARVPVSDEAGVHLEIALLADGPDVRLAEVEHALALDRNLAAWALAAAENRLGRTINRVGEAAAWLSERLVTELAKVIVGESAESPASSIDWRLPALVRLLSAEQLQRADFDHRLEREKLDAIKELAYGASHEINNPLANIAARAQTLLDDEQDPQRRQKLIAIHRQAMRAHEMISDLMLFARPPKLSPTTFRVDDFVQKVVAGLDTLAQENSVLLEFQPGEHPEVVSADETQLGVALHALVQNSIEAVGEGGHVSAVANRIELAGKPWIEIAVRDDGPGISAEARRHIFDPFYSGREAGRGLGFGLSKCWRIVIDHGGQVLVQSPAGGGAEISMLLPLATGAANPQSHAS
jgi:signal transduction histidine kinase